jgi:hypothetical protein
MKSGLQTQRTAPSENSAPLGRACSFNLSGICPVRTEGVPPYPPTPLPGGNRFRV